MIAETNIDLRDVVVDALGDWPSHVEHRNTAYIGEYERPVSVPNDGELRCDITDWVRSCLPDRSVTVTRGGMEGDYDVSADRFRVVVLDAQGREVDGAKIVMVADVEEAR